MEQSMNRHNSSISNFRREYVFAGKLVVMLLLLLAFFNHVMPQYSEGYNASLIDKAARLKSLDGPKIVLLGNSNLAFGMRSERLENEFGLPVVNMGLHGGLGNAFHEEMARIHVCEGDIYILCHTSYSDDDTIQDPNVAWIAIENNLQLWGIIRKRDIRAMIGAFPVYLKNCLDLYAEGNGNEDGQGVYARNAFNRYGDVAVGRQESKFVFKSGSVTVPEINEVTVNRINELNRWLKERGATLLIAGYPIGKGEYTPDEAEYEKFQKELADQMECDVISDFTDYMYDYKYFYDTNFHLTDAGAAMRTEQLIEDLRRWKGDDAWPEAER